jgi:hypothetical protein
MPGVPKGRHNVAHHGSGGKMFKVAFETPVGVTLPNSAARID